MAENKAGIRFSQEEYIFVNMETMKLIKETPEGIEEYTIGESGTGSSTLDLRGFPQNMTAGDTYQINYTVSEGATIEFSSNASNSKISVDENGLMTCIGSTTGACVITITSKNSSGDIINESKMRVTVV